MNNLKEPIKIALIYFAIGIVWILLSDQVLLLFLSQNELKDLSYLQTIKGFFYVSITALLLFFLVKKYCSTLIHRVKELENLNMQLTEQKRELLESTENLIESEKKFSDLFNVCPLPMWVFDQKTYKYLDVNLAAMNHYGYSKDEFLSMTIMDIRPPEEVDRVKKMVEFMIAGKTSVLKGVFKHYKKDGEIIHVRIKSNAIKFNGKNASLVVANDITELLQTQQELRDAYDSIVQIEDSERERFAGELHDSFGQNLIAIKHFISMLSEDGLSESKKTMYTMLQEVVDNLIKECKQIIHDIRPKELYDSGLKNIIQSTCDRVNFAGTLKIKYELADDIDDQLHLNIKFHLFRIFQENLNNTMKHANATEAVVELARRNKKIHFFYSDNGIGIEPKILHAESSFLSLKRRVISLGGTYDIQSDLGSGMVFYCKIPIAEQGD